MDQALAIKMIDVPYKGTGDLSLAVLGGHIDGAMTYTLFAIANKGKVRPYAVAMEQRHPRCPMRRSSGARRRLGRRRLSRHRRPKATSAEQRCKLSRAVRRARR